MKKILLLKKTEDCTGCEGSAFQINEYGFVRPCAECARDHKKYADKYGSHLTDMARAYIDVERGICRKITDKEEKQGFLLLKNKEIIYFNTSKYDNTL